MSGRYVRCAAGLAVCALASTGLVGWVESPASAVACASGLAGDVNGDGHAEAAVGEPFDADLAGAVHVFYGTFGGLVVDAAGSARDDQLFTQDTPGVPGAAEPTDLFGRTSELTDFNADGCADLAVSASGENANAGMVIVLYGSPGGVTTTGAQLFTENSLFGAGSGVGGEEFGEELGSGDFNDDGIPDLVVGARGEIVTPGSFSQVGGLVVIYGAAGGLGTGATPSALITQASSGVPGTPELGDLFGSALSAGDFNGNGVDDLAVGVPGENGSGIVQVLPGEASTGLGALAAVSYSQNTAGVPGVAEAGDAFGSAAAAGDATGNGRDDLAIGAPGENGGDGEVVGAGAVTFLPGSASGLTGTGSQNWSQNSPGVAGAAADPDRFGESLVMAPLDNGPLVDLAIGVPFDEVGPVSDAGAVNILLGRASGLSTSEAGGQRFHQDTDGIAGIPESGDRFGLSVAAPQIQTTGQGSLLIGAPSETVAGVESTGLFHQLATFEFGPNPLDSRTFNLDTPGVRGTPEGTDLFGFDVT